MHEVVECLGSAIVRFQLVWLQCVWWVAVKVIPPKLAECAITFQFYRVLLSESVKGMKVKAKAGMVKRTEIETNSKGWW